MLHKYQPSLLYHPTDILYYNQMMTICAYFLSNVFAYMLSHNAVCEKSSDSTS